MVKLVRALNDNFASVFYNETGSLAGYFWLGFLVCVFSLISAYFLTDIHESVFETSGTKQKNKEDK